MAHNKKILLECYSFPNYKIKYKDIILTYTTGTHFKGSDCLQEVLI